MSWRTVIVSKKVKLELCLGYLVVRGEENMRIFVDELSVLIIENTGVSITSNLMVELTKNKVKVIFCDEKRNPSFELMPYYGSHDTSMKFKEQIKWQDKVKEKVWAEIVRAKIRFQRDFLKELGLVGYKKVEKYLSEIEDGDYTNREAHAAKVYFTSLFGNDFSRSYESYINACLNYGYSIILSYFNREIVSNGYFTQLGIFHHNMYNSFNLSSDLMEPFRPLIDRIVLDLRGENFGVEEKTELVNVLNKVVIINNKKQYVSNAISIYVRSVLDALAQDDISILRFYNGV